jgi:NhaA family Na+:H+ antiporter
MTPFLPSRGPRALLGRETTGGLLILLGAVAGLVLANAPTREAFEAVSSARVGPAAIGPLPLHLDLAVGQWAQDGLLTVFFFTVGLELIQEFRVGSLRRPRQAAVPVLAAMGGVAAPALVYLAVDALAASGAHAHGWAIPTATDIAFAVSVLALFGRGLPGALRSFLLTLAVVDDLIGILLIAVFYPAEGGISPLALIGSLAMVAVFAVLARRRRMRWWLMAPAAVAAWALMHASGVHPTIAGVALGLVVPAGSGTAGTGSGAAAGPSRATRIDLALRPLSNGIALPVFAVFAAGVPLDPVGGPGRSGLLAQPLVWAVSAALVLGKPLGVLLTTKAVTAWTRLRLPDSIGVRDLLPVGLLCGIGFTVSMLIAGLSFEDPSLVDEARAAVLVGSTASAVLGAALLRHDARRVRGSDMNEDGAPDRDRRIIR